MDLALQSGQTQIPTNMNREDKRAFILAKAFKDKVEAKRGHSEGHEPLGGVSLGILIQRSHEPSFEVPAGLDREQRREFCKNMLNEEDWTNI